MVIKHLVDIFQSVQSIMQLSLHRTSNLIPLIILFFPSDKVQISYSRSSGPGGQNVNCVNTKAEIRFHLSSADWIPEAIRLKLAEQLRNSTTKEGHVVVKSDKTRSQQLNLADALDKLRNMIHQAAESLVAPQPTSESLEKHRRL
jgi:peptidyl-tRNA hydrolase ICT1